MRINKKVILVTGIVFIFLMIIGTTLMILHENADDRYLISSSEIKAMEISRVNINIADEEGLMILPGITEKLAQNILAYREENGAFQTPEDIIKVKGIGEKTFEYIKLYITV